jgi:C2H2-type zinc finger
VYIFRYRYNSGSAKMIRLRNNVGIYRYTIFPPFGSISLRLCDNVGNYVQIIFRAFQTNFVWTYFAFGAGAFGRKSFGPKCHLDIIRQRSNFVRRKEHSDTGRSVIWQCTGTGLVSLIFFLFCRHSSEKHPDQEVVYNCTMCHKGFVSFNALRLHQKSHYNVDPVMQVSCFWLTEKFVKARFGLSRIRPIFFLSRIRPWYTTGTRSRIRILQIRRGKINVSFSCSTGTGSRSLMSFFIQIEFFIFFAISTGKNLKIYRFH